MGWLRDLILGRDIPKSPSYGVALEEPDPIDWTAIEEQLVDLAQRSIAEFAERHQRDSFYGLGFDCNSSEGEVLLCLNSRAAQRKSAQKTDGPYKESLLSMTEAERLASTEWGFGDWKYQGFNARSKLWRSEWRASALEIANAQWMLLLNNRHAQARALREEFMRMACRAILRVVTAPAIAALQRDPDFRVLCTDHDEGPDEGFKRLHEVATDAS